VRAAAVLALLAVGLASPSAQAATPGIDNPPGPAPVTLYFHIADFQDFPINTQEPAKDYVAESGQGITTSSTGCLPPTPAGTGQSFHTLYGFSSPGFVEYGYVEDNRPRFHPERGLSYDVGLAGDTLTMHWYLATDSGLPALAGRQAPGAPLPQVVVAATLRTGENVTVDGSGYNSGTLIAQGASEPATLAGPATGQLSPGVNWTQAGGQDIYEIRVPLSIAQHVIPRAGGFSLRVDTFVAVPGPCADPSQGYLMPNFVRVHSSAGFRPRLDVRLTEPVRIEYLHPQFVGDKLYVHVSANSPWGNYDVDVRNGTRLTISGPTLAASLRLEAVVQRTHEHGAHTQPVDVTYAWPFARDGARDGAYDVVLEVQNGQHTATASASASFVLGPQLQVTRCGSHDGGAASGCTTEAQDAFGNPVAAPQASPSPLLGGLLVVLGLGAAAARRRG
jgi:hypothetical protein